MTDQITYRDVPPTAAEFAQLRSACGWGDISLQTAERALQAGQFDLTCFDGDALIGMGRVVGDGALYFYLQDIIVSPAYQNRAIGRAIVSKLLDRVMAQAEKGATIGLMAAEGKEAFYGRFGFQQRPARGLGAGMTRFVL